MSWESWWNDHLLWKNSLEHYDFGKSSSHKQENVELIKIKRLKYCSPVDEIPDLGTKDEKTKTNKRLDKSMSDNQSQFRIISSEENNQRRKLQRSRGTRKKLFN